MEPDEIELLQRENKRLSECLRYLASCNAATLEGLPAKYAESRARRFRSIAEESLKFLNGGTPNRPGPHDWVVDRLKRALNPSQP